MTIDTTRAARLSADRGRLCSVFSVLALIWTSILVERMATGTVGWIDVAAWCAWLVVATVWTFGSPVWARRWSRRERLIVNDELARDHQRSAALLASGVLMAGMALGCLDALGLIQLPNWWPVAALGLGVSASGLRFGRLQMRS